MQSTAVFAAMIFFAMFIPILIAICLPFLPLILSGAEERAHARRLADARMNARLLRLNL
jgi:hypothetical protein